MIIKPDQIADFVKRIDAKWVDLFEHPHVRVFTYAAEDHNKGADWLAAKVREYVDTYPGVFQAYFKKTKGLGKEYSVIVEIDARKGLESEKPIEKPQPVSGAPYGDLEKYIEQREKAIRLEMELEQLKNQKEQTEENSLVGFLREIMYNNRGYSGGKRKFFPYYNPDNNRPKQLQQMSGTPDTTQKRTPEQLLSGNNNNNNEHANNTQQPHNQLTDQAAQKAVIESIAVLVDTYGQERVANLMMGLANKAKTTPQAIDALENLL